MTTNFTPINTNADANASTFNTPLGQLDTALVDVQTTVGSGALSTAPDGTTPTTLKSASNKNSNAIGLLSGFAGGVYSSVQGAFNALKGRIDASHDSGGNLKADTVSNATIVDSSINSVKLAASAVTNAKLATDAVTSGNIADSAVTTAKIANSAVDGNKIGSGVIATGHIANSAVDNTKLGPDVKVGSLAALITAVKSTIAGAINELAGEVQNARHGYSSLQAYLDSLVLAGSSSSTTASGTNSAGASTLNVADSGPFVVGQRIGYTLSGGTIEYNSVGSKGTGTLGLNVSIGTGGITASTQVFGVSEESYQSSRAIKNGNSAIRTLVDTIRYMGRQVRYAEAFGADRTGATGSETATTAAVKAAIADLPAAGGVIKFPEGLFLMDVGLTALNFGTKSVLFVGSGWGTYVRANAADAQWISSQLKGTVLRFLNTTHNGIDINTTLGRRIVIRDMALIGPRASGGVGTSTIGVNISVATDNLRHMFENVLFSNWGTGIKIANSFDLTFRSCHWIGNDVGIEAGETSTTNCRFYDSFIENNGVGVLGLGGTLMRFYGGTIQTNVCAVRLAPNAIGGLTHWTFDGFWIEDQRGNVFEFDLSTGPIVKFGLSNCRFSDGDRYFDGGATQPVRIVYKYINAINRGFNDCYFENVLNSGATLTLPATASNTYISGCQFASIITNNTSTTQINVKTLAGAAFSTTASGTNAEGAYDLNVAAVGAAGVGQRIYYTLSGGSIEYNLITKVVTGTLSLYYPIGTGGLTIGSTVAGITPEANGGTRLSNVKSISGGVANGNNFAGLATISNTATFVDVTFANPEPDASYIVFAFPMVQSTVATGACRLWVSSQTVSGFRVNCEVAPGTGKDVLAGWIIVQR